MKKACIIILIITLGQLQLVSQKASREFGNISQKEVDMISYEKDTDAEAVVLFDLGKSYFRDTENGYDVVFERVTRIKIFSEAGLKWAEFEVPYYHEGTKFEKVYDIEAITYNFDNGRLSKSPVSKEDIHIETINENWKVKKVALPNVKPGSIIEYKYKVSSPYHFNLRDWEFQSTIPVIYSEYITKMIPFYTYTWILQGASKFSSTWSYDERGFGRRFGSITFNDMVYHYVMEDVPAFNDEEFISSVNDYIIKMDFQLSEFNSPSGGKTKIMTTWPAMIKDLLKHNDFGRFVKKSEKMSSKLMAINEIANKSSREKFDAVLNYVKKNYNWNGRKSKYASKSPNQLVKDKFGNCADINLLTVGLLRGVGVNADPLITSTREHGKIKIDYPFAHFFDYVIVQVKIDGKTVLADATENSISNERIPTRCLNDAGLVIKNDEQTWLNLECNFPSSITTNIIIDSIGAEVSATVKKKATEYNAYYYRSKFGKDIKKLKDKFEKDSYQLDESSVSIYDFEDLKKPYSFKYNVITNGELINDKIYLSPFLNEAINENPLKQKSRSYPIDMVYPDKRVYHSVIKIPSGYKLDYVGENYDINNELFALQYKTDLNGDYLQVSFVYYFKKSVYSAKDYLKIKLYFKEIIKRANEKVVFAKI